MSDVFMWILTATGILGAVGAIIGVATRNKIVVDISTIVAAFANWVCVLVYVFWNG